MYLNSKLNFRKFLIALLSMFMAVILAFSVACDDGDGGDDDGGDDEPTTTTVTDYQEIANGDFEFYTTEKSSYPYTSSIKWSKVMGSDVTVSPSSSASSGIIDTTDDVFNKLTAANKPSQNPKTPYGKGLLTDADNKYDEEKEETYIYPQIKGSKVLMINNKNAEGCAQSYKSTSQISLSADKYAVISLWVKTMDISSNYKEKAGAFVRLTPTSGNKTFEPFMLENINTDSQWAKITVAFEGSELNSTTIDLTVGLGEGNGTDYNDLVKGCVFLDNVYLEYIDKATFEGFTGHTKVTVANFGRNDLSATTFTNNDTATDNVKEKYTELKYTLDFNDIDDEANFLTKVVPSQNSINYSSSKPGYTYANGNVIGYGDATTAKGASASIKNAIGDNENGFTNFIYMSFANNSSANFVTDVFSLSENKFDYFTFYAKVKANNANSDKLKVDVIDVTNVANGGKEVTTSIFSSFDTASVTSERYGDFIKYQIFINNPTNKSASYKLKFTFGFDEEWVDQFALQTGYAIIADLAYHRDINENFYTNAAADDTISKTQIYGEYISYDNATEESNKSDVYPVTVDKSQTFTVMNKPATNVQGYAFRTTDASKAFHGIINSNYYDSTNNIYGIDPNNRYGAFENGMNADMIKALTTTGNTHLQALVIDNKDNVTSKYISAVQSIASGSLYKISIRLRVLGNSTAKVQLVESTPDSSNNNDYKVQSISNGVASYDLSSTVTKSSYVKDGWTSVHFYVKAGNEAFRYRVAIVNEGKGTIITEGANYMNIDEARFSTDKLAIKLDFASLNNTADEYKFNTLSHKRPDSIIKTTGEDGEVIETTQSYNPTEIYFANNYAKFITFETLFADEVIDNTTPTDDSTTEEEDHEHEDEYNVTLDATLQISSIIIALVLIAVIIVIVLRKVFAKRAKRIAKTERYYETNSLFDRDAREKTYNKVARRKAKIALAEDDEEYDYSEAENVDEAENVEEAEVIEETTETVPETIEVEIETTEQAENVENSENETENN